jgi:predicted nucleic acid-binding protein
LILIDTSAWVEYLRDTGSDACEAVDRMIQDQDATATCDVVIMELLSGTRTGDDWRSIWALMNSQAMLPVRPLFDYEVAAELFRRCRQAGFRPANSNDLLISAVAIGREVPLLAADADYQQIAAVSSLRLEL